MEEEHPNKTPRIIQLEELDSEEPRHLQAMDQEVLAQFSGLSTADILVDIEDELGELVPEKWGLGIIFRLRGDKHFNAQVFVKVVAGAWKLEKEVEIRRLGHNLFIAKFQHLMDYEKVLYEKVHGRLRTN